VTPHDLRRTLGSWQAKTGASLAIIGKSLNHKSQQATAIHARLDLDPARASADALSRRLRRTGSHDDLGREDENCDGDTGAPSPHSCKGRAAPAG
jgi:hypothetical protein